MAVASQQSLLEVSSGVIVRLSFIVARALPKSLTVCALMFFDREKEDEDCPDCPDCDKDLEMADNSLTRPEVPEMLDDE